MTANNQWQEGRVEALQLTPNSALGYGDLPVQATTETTTTTTTDGEPKPGPMPVPNPVPDPAPPPNQDPAGWNKESSTPPGPVPTPGT